MHEKKILNICVNNINDEEIKHKLIFSVVEQRWNQARLLSEGLVEDYPDDESFKELDTLITDNCM